MVLGTVVVFAHRYWSAPFSWRFHLALHLVSEQICRACVYVYWSHLAQVDTAEQGIMVVRAAKAIAQGEEVCMSLASTAQCWVWRIKEVLSPAWAERRA